MWTVHQISCSSRNVRKVVHQEEYIHSLSLSNPLFLAPLNLGTVLHLLNILRLQCPWNPSQSRKQQNELWCYCRTGESREMICCDSKSCNIQWFHTTCLRIAKILKGNWLCPDCRGENEKTPALKEHRDNAIFIDSFHTRFYIQHSCT